MNTARHVSSQMSQEFVVELKNEYKGKYRVFLVGEHLFAFFDAPILLQVLNEDILALLKNTIYPKI